MIVPQLDLKRQHGGLREEIRDALDRVHSSATFILGEEVDCFEREFAAHVEAKHCIAVNSGTSALHLALTAAGVGRGDEVITTANTLIATAEAISYTGAEPVFVDIDPATGNIDSRRIERAMTSQTRALLPVHLYGRPAGRVPKRVWRIHHTLFLRQIALPGTSWLSWLRSPSTRSNTRYSTVMGKKCKNAHIFPASMAALASGESFFTSRPDGSV